MSEAKRYGVRVRKAEADPDVRVEYIMDAEGMAPAHMDYENDVFDYGDWADAWFVAGNYPCMVKRDGTEAYKLDPADYTYKEDGGASEVGGVRGECNAMAAMPTVWVKSYEDDEYQYFIVCEERYDDDYKAYAHTRDDGSIADTIYYPMFEGHIHEGRLRSLMGVSPSVNTTMYDEIAAAKANGPAFNIETWAAYNLMAILLLVMGCTDDVQKAFGAGHVSGADGKTRPLPQFTTGKIARTAQFYGSESPYVANKVFHIEHPWGDRFDRLVGLVCDHGVMKAKMSGPYNVDDLSDYVETGAVVSGENRTFIDKSFVSEYGRIPVSATPDAQGKYQSARFVFNPDACGQAMMGGNIDEDDGGSCWMMNIKLPADGSNWHMGASLFCIQP